MDTKFLSTNEDLSMNTISSAIMQAFELNPNTNNPAYIASKQKELQKEDKFGALTFLTGLDGKNLNQVADILNVNATQLKACANLCSLL
ncbi:MAG: hypothetical protein COA63_000660 [Methylophaga sp.]|nr:hypothetical protein [Methylophaga sp.]